MAKNGDTKSDFCGGIDIVNYMQHSYIILLYGINNQSKINRIELLIVATLFFGLLGFQSLISLHFKIFQLLLSTTNF